jgi:hypothetical protein
MAQEVNLLDNLRTIVGTAREAGIKVFHVPHHRWEPGDYVKNAVKVEAGQGRASLG